jgi:hypothetical protein
MTDHSDVNLDIDVDVDKDINIDVCVDLDLGSNVAEANAEAAASGGYCYDLIAETYTNAYVNPEYAAASSWSFAGLDEKDHKS